MTPAMKAFDSARRDLLRLSSMGLAASAVSAIPALGAAKKAAAPPLSPMLFDVRTFGATGDGKTVDSPAINKAIEAAAAAGGGTVIFPAGNYLSFSIRLKSHVDLYLSQGCAIIAADSPLPGQTTGYMGGTYDPAEPKTAWDAYQDYGHNHWHNSLLWGDGISDFSITGPGLIWGKGLSFGAGPGRPPADTGGATGVGTHVERPGDPGTPGAAAAAGGRGGAGAAAAPGAAAGAGAAGGRGGAGASQVLGNGRVAMARGTYPMYQAEQPGVGNKAIGLKNCHNVVLRDFSILKGGHFAILVTGVDNLTIDNLKIDTDRDGMDIDCCKNVRVSNCTVNSPWDDAIVPKSSFALGYNRPRKTSTSPTAMSPAAGSWALCSTVPGSAGRIGGTGRIKFGTESNGGFNNITISNCVFEGCQGLALETVDGALLEDYCHHQHHHARHRRLPIFLRLGAACVAPRVQLDRPEHRPRHPQARTYLQHHCHNTVSRFASNITGIPGFPVET